MTVIPYQLQWERVSRKRNDMLPGSRIAKPGTGGAFTLGVVVARGLGWMLLLCEVTL